MKIKDIQREKKEERKTTSITVRTYPSVSKWLSKNNISPTKLFNETINVLMGEKK